MSDTNGWTHCKRCKDPVNGIHGENSTIEMIACNACESWFHLQCAEVAPNDLARIDKYHCEWCMPSHGPSTWLRKSKRSHANLDYVSLDAGEAVAADQHAYTALIRTRTFTPDQFLRMEGSKVTVDWAKKDGLHEPVIVPVGGDMEGLDMELPWDLTVKQVAELVGTDEKLEVIDVPTQGEVAGWTLGQWADYYERGGTRDRVRNVISLEVSSSKLGALCRRPRLVRDLDLVDRVWPDADHTHQGFPKVQLYCLMSVANSYTDFHIDFGGSSVFYHILRGNKTFLFIPPTSTNLKKYEQWCLSSDQNKTFLADQVKQCFKVELKKGDTMIIPSGWIHAVYTPTDSLVIGGNFLTPIHVQRQIAIADIEEKTRVPRKFRFPSFSRVLWMTALYFMASGPKDLSSYEQEGLPPLAEYLHRQVQIIRGDIVSPKEVRRSRDAIPLGEDAAALAVQFAVWVKSVVDADFIWLAEEESKLAGVKKRKSEHRNSVPKRVKHEPDLVLPKGEAQTQHEVADLSVKASFEEPKMSSFDSPERSFPDKTPVDNAFADLMRAVGLGLRPRVSY